MKIRVTIVAMLAVLCLSLGAYAGDKVKYDGANSVKFQLSFQPFDTADYVGVDVAGVVNDTIGPFYGPVFRYDHQFGEIDFRFFQTIADTCTAVGLARDSLYLFGQSKTDNDSDLTWFTFWTSDLMPAIGFDTAGGWNLGTAAISSIPSDSLPSLGNLFRFGYYLINDSDSSASAAALFYGADSTINPLQELWGQVFFRPR